MGNLLLLASRRYAELDGQSTIVFLIEEAGDVFEEFVQTFARCVLQLEDRRTVLHSEFVQEFLLGVLSDGLGFAGVEMIRRTIGIGHVADLESIPDRSCRVAAERKSLEIAQHLIRNSASGRLHPGDISLLLRDLLAKP